MNNNYIHFNLLLGFKKGQTMLNKKTLISGLVIAVMSLSSVGSAFADEVIISNGKDSGHGVAVITGSTNENDIIPYADNKYIYNSNNVRVGYWIYGKKDGNVISEYKPYVGEGRASVTNGKGAYDDGGWVKPNDDPNWSRAKQPWTFWGQNRADYDYCCTDN